MKKFLKLIAFSILALSPLFAFASIDVNLKYGSTGKQVTELQQFLISKNFLHEQATGNFFSVTRNAVVAYQAENGLPTTGAVGPLTRKKINAELARVGTTSPTLSTEAQTNSMVSGCASVAGFSTLTGLPCSGTVAMSHSSTTGSLSQTIVTPPVPSTDLSLSPPTYFYDFAGDPPAYLGAQIKVKGIINGQFLAAGDKGGSSNYIGIADPNARSSATVMLRILNKANYQKAVSALQTYDLVALYGSGASSVYFTMNSGTQILVPVIDVARLDVIGACGPSGCGEGSVKTIFP